MLGLISALANQRQDTHSDIYKLGRDIQPQLPETEIEVMGTVGKGRGRDLEVVATHGAGPRCFEGGSRAMADL
jgi:hypothetical protein